MKTLLLIIFTLYSVYANDIDYFKENKEKIIQEIKDLSKKQDHINALKLIGKYSAINDKDLIHLQKNISLDINQKAKKEKEKRLLEELKSISPTTIDRKNEIYKELSYMYPDNKKYIKEVAYYEKEIQKQKIEIEKENKIFGIQPIKNYENIYIEVKDYLKQNMHDPSSLEFKSCTDVFRKSEKGWMVACQYRGKNAYGATVINTNWFIIRQGKVINVESIDKYKIE